MFFLLEYKVYTFKFGFVLNSDMKTLVSKLKIDMTNFNLFRLKRLNY